MRLLATFLVVAKISAADIFEEALSRSKRQTEVETDVDVDVQCDEGDLEYDGICYANSQENQELISELSQFDSPLLRGGRGGLATTRAKKRSQRLTLLVSKLRNSDAARMPNGKPMKPALFAQRMNNYGCHCWPDYPQIENLSGQGASLDAIDSSCHKLQDCHACLKQEYGAEVCDPVNTRYIARLVGDEIRCMNKSTGKQACKRNLCECDKKFSNDFAASFGSWSSEFAALKDKNIYDDFCRKPRNDGRQGIDSALFVKDSCCGTYPDIKPYSSQTHECDGKRVFGKDTL